MATGSSASSRQAPPSLHQPGDGSEPGSPSTWQAHSSPHHHHPSSASVDLAALAVKSPSSSTSSPLSRPRSTLIKQDVRWPKATHSPGKIRGWPTLQSSRLQHEQPTFSPYQQQYSVTTSRNSDGATDVCMTERPKRSDRRRPSSGEPPPVAARDHWIGTTFS